MKLVIFLFALVVLVQSNTTQELKGSYGALQLIYNGFFAEAGLDNPTTIMNEYDDNSAPLTFHYLATLFKQMANNNFVAIPKTNALYKRTVGTELDEKLRENEEWTAAKKAYGFFGFTTMQVQEIVLAWAFSHPVPFHQHSLELDTNYYKGNFEQVGRSAGLLAKKVFQRSGEKLEFGDPLRYLYQIFQGLWRQADLPDPISPTNCFNEESALLTLEYIQTLSVYLAYNNFVPITAITNNFLKEIPEATLKCWNDDTQVEGMEKAYGIDDMKVSGIQNRVAVYAAKHYQEFNKIAMGIHNNFQNSRFINVGDGYGEILEKSI